jgi:predicted nucleic acid-binding protein
MAVYFLDSSALVKPYVNEAGSAWILGLFDPALNHDLFIIAITSVEIVAAIRRRSRGGSIAATDAATACHQFRLDIQADYQVVEVTQNIINSAMMFAEIYGLRVYDFTRFDACFSRQ